MSLLGVSNLVLHAREYWRVDASASFAEGAVNVDFDASIVVSLLLFVGLLLVLKPLLFAPMMRLFDEREARIDRTIQGAVKLDQKSADALAEYERIMAKAREAGAAERDRLRGAGAKQESQLLAEVRGQTAATLAAGRSATAKEADAARQALEEEAGVLGRAIASRVLGRQVSP